MDFIFRELYQEEIDQVAPDICAELAGKIEALECEKKSLQGSLNELKGRMLEFIVHRELNKCAKERKVVGNLKKRLRPVSDGRRTDSMEETLTAASRAKFDMVWMNYFIQAQETTPMEVDVLAEGKDADGAYALAFEIKNRDEKNLPTMTEAKLFAIKAAMVMRWLNDKGGKIQFVCPVYLSAEGFDPDVEDWLHEQGVFTSDLESWNR